jgi:hypothetical protein
MTKIDHIRHSIIFAIKNSINECKKRIRDISGTKEAHYALMFLGEITSTLELSLEEITLLESELERLRKSNSDLSSKCAVLEKTMLEAQQNLLEAQQKNTKLQEFNHAQAIEITGLWKKPYPKKKYIYPTFLSDEDEEYEYKQTDSIVNIKTKTSYALDA